MLHYDYHTIDLEISYIHYVRLISVAVNEMFKEEIMGHLSDLLVDGQLYSGGIKGYERMQNKLKSFADHWNSGIPRSAENVDAIRCIAVFNTADEIVKAVDRLVSGMPPVVFGKVRVLPLACVSFDVPLCDCRRITTAHS